jgi:single-stranded-DNA-specific exonuclease
MTLLPEQVDQFSAKFEDIVSSTIDPNLLIPHIIIDASIRFVDLNSRFYNILQQMESFGTENLR